MSVFGSTSFQQDYDMEEDYGGEEDNYDGDVTDDAPTFKQPLPSRGTGIRPTLGVPTGVKPKIDKAAAARFILHYAGKPRTVTKGPDDDEST